MLGAVSEPVVGAAIVRAYGVEERTQARIDAAIDGHARSAHPSAQMTVAVSFSLGGVLGRAWSSPAVVGLGVLLGVRGSLTLGELVAFLFLVQLFIGPVQIGHRGAQRAAERDRRLAPRARRSSTRRPTSPTRATTARSCRGGRSPSASSTCRFAYPGGPDVLRDVDLDIAAGTRIAIVGETGSGKSTLAKLLTRLMDPSRGRGARSTASTCGEVRFSSLRERVVLVPQEGFLVRRHPARERRATAAPATPPRHDDPTRRAR